MRLKNNIKKISFIFIMLVISLTLFSVKEIKIKAETNSSKLIKLEVENYESDLNPTFDKDTLEYNIEVMENEIDLNINYETEDSNANVKVTGNKYIKNNTGEIDITVTNSDSKTIYKINYTKVTLEENYDFDYTGDEQVFTVPATGKYKLETWGAQGYSISSYTGGYGGYSNGATKLKRNSKLYVYVGQQGLGGLANGSVYKSYPNSGTSSNNDNASYIGSGGGSTHISSISGFVNDFDSDNKDDLLIIAGGGGSATYSPSGKWSGSGGAGGGYIANSGNGTFTAGGGGSQTTGGSKGNSCTAGTFGLGANGSGASGGGGLYGGGCSWGGAAGGGSGYIANPKLTDKVMYCYNCGTSTDESTKTISTTNASEEPISEYAKKGNGYAKVTLQSLISEDNYLSSLSVDHGTLSPNFDPTIENYTLALDKYDINFTLTGELSDEKSTVTGLEKYEIAQGETKTVNVIVTSESEK